MDVPVQARPDWSKRTTCWCVMRNSELETMKVTAAQGNLQRLARRVRIRRDTGRRRSHDSSRPRFVCRASWKSCGSRKRSLQRQLELVQEDWNSSPCRSPIDGQVDHLEGARTVDPPPGGKGPDPDDSRRAAGRVGAGTFRCPKTDMGYINDARRELGDEPAGQIHHGHDPGATHEGKIKEIGTDRRSARRGGQHRADPRGDRQGGLENRASRPAPASTAKVYVGRASIGYVWFHDLISFVQSKILFRILLVPFDAATTPQKRPRWRDTRRRCPMLVHSLMTTMLMALATGAGQPAAARRPKRSLTTATSPRSITLSCPASDAGMLMNLHARRRAVSSRRTRILATIDDREAKALYDVKRFDYEVAKQLAESDSRSANAISRRRRGRDCAIRNT